jgi:hypothetical protein
MNGEPYRNSRFYENCEKRIFDCVGSYGIPPIGGVQTVGHIDECIGFNYALREKKPEEKAVHFFLDDYLFERIWRSPDRYIPVLGKFKYVFSPDFSPYCDFPKAIQIYNHYRKHWMGAYMQEHGIDVIPTVTWSNPSSYDFCFDGEPIKSVVAVSSVGCLTWDNGKRMFLNGYEEMMKRLEPSAILFYGTVPKECEGNIIPLKAFQERYNGKKTAKLCEDRAK